jgi:hypothetical protein
LNAWKHKESPERPLVLYNVTLSKWVSDCCLTPNE